MILSSLRGAFAPKQSRVARVALDCSHGDEVCQGIWSALGSIAGQLFVPTTRLLRWRAQIGSRPALWAAAQRLGLDAIEHAIRLLWSERRALNVPIISDLGFEPFGNLVCMPDQTHIRSSLDATAPIFRLRRAGSRGRGHSSLRRLKPSNPSVRPPGSAGADQPRRIGCPSRSEADLRRSSSRLPRSRRHGPHTSTRRRAVCAPAQRSRSCGRAHCGP